MPGTRARLRVSAVGLFSLLIGAALVPAARAATGDVTEYPVPTASSLPQGIAVGADGALWFAERSANAIGRITVAGQVTTEFPVPTAASQPFWVTAGPDGNVWFTERSGNRIGRIGAAGVITEFTVPTAGSVPAGITTGPDGNLWFTEQTGNALGRITPDGTITEFPIPTASAGPFGIATGPDGNLWFTEQSGNAVGRSTTDGVITEFPLTVANRLPTGITAGPDGNLWFTERNGGAVGQMDTTGALLNEFVVPALTPNLQGIAQGPDGNLWFAESGANRVGRITTDGTITEFVLPNAGSQPFAVTGGPDDGVWFTEQSGNRIGRAVSQEPDTTPPTVTITTPADGAVFAVGDEVLADYGCVDEPGGSGVDACHGPVPAGSPIDTSLGVHTFTVHASDVAGNLATASTTYEVVDVTPPTITITVPADGALFAVGDVVAADYGCADEVGGSGLATCDGPVADGEAIDTTLGTHTFTVDATDVAGNPASASTTYEVVAAPSDTTPPTVTITTPAEASVYSVGQVVKADFACADEGGGSGLLTCAGTVADGSSIDTTLGTHVFTVTATDGAGNTVTVSTHYAVLSGLSGSLLPYPTLNVESAGTALPVTFDLGPAAAASASTHTKTGSARPRALETVPPFAAGYPASQQVDCDAPNVALGPLEPADVNAQLSKTGRLHVVWKTRQSWAGTCRAFAMRFDLDGWRDAPVTFLVRFTP